MLHRRREKWLICSILGRCPLVSGDRLDNLGLLIEKFEVESREGSESAVLAVIHRRAVIEMTGLNAERTVAKVKYVSAGRVSSGLREGLPVSEVFATGERARTVSTAVDSPEPDQTVTRWLNSQI